MAQKLRALAVHAKDLVPSSHSSQLTMAYNSSSRRSDTLFRTLWAPGMHTVHTHACTQNTSTHKVKRNVYKDLKIVN